MRASFFFATIEVMSGTDDRDRDLDEFEAAVQGFKPFIHEPEEKEPRDGVGCFLDQLRACNTDCAAFVQGEEDGPERCTILVAAQALTRFLSPLQKRGEDAEREAMSKIPVPRV